MFELQISALPREILLCVFQFLPPQEICTQAAKVSKLFNELAVEPVLWKHFCEANFFVMGKCMYTKLHSSRCMLILNLSVMNHLALVRWQYEYFIMQKEWDTLVVNNGVRVADIYKDVTLINNNGEDGAVFENLRNVPNNDRPPPIVSFVPPLSLISRDYLLLCELHLYALGSLTTLHTVQGIHPLRPLPVGDFSIGYYEIRLDDQGAEQ